MTGAGTGDVAVVIVDPQGRRDTVEVALEDKGDNTFRCTYRPVMEGPHTVHVAFAGAPITRSPFPVHVAEGEGSPPFLHPSPSPWAGSIGRHIPASKDLQAVKHYIRRLRGWGQPRKGSAHTATPPCAPAQPKVAGPSEKKVQKP